MDTPQDNYQSPLEMLSIARFSGRTYLDEKLVTVGTTRVTLLPNNPNRLFWMVTNEGLSDVRVSTDASLSSSSGWILAANGGIITMWWEQDGEGVGYEVYALSVAAGMVVRVREVIRL